MTNDSGVSDTIHPKRMSSSGGRGRGSPPNQPPAGEGSSEQYEFSTTRLKLYDAQDYIVASYVDQLQPLVYSMRDPCKALKECDKIVIDNWQQVKAVAQFLGEYYPGPGGWRGRVVAQAVERDLRVIKDEITRTLNLPEMYPGVRFEYKVVPR